MNELHVNISEAQQVGRQRRVVVFLTLLIVFTSLLLYYTPKHFLIGSCIAAVVLTCFMTLVIYYFIAPLSLWNTSYWFYLAVVLCCTCVMTSTYLYLFENDIILYPYFIYHRKDTFHILNKVAMWFCITSCIYHISRTLYVYFNTYVLSKRQYGQMLKAWETDINLLRSESNPYYLNKSLQNLQRIIQDGDFDKAILYNAEVASLLKKQMVYSSAEYISMEEEVEWLRHYVKVEQLRIYERLHFNIVVNDDDVYLQKVPPMLIQPIVESVLSSANYSTGRPTLLIEITDQEQEVFIRVDYSDGDGRYLNNRKSPALINLEHRIQLINRLNKFHLQLTNQEKPDGVSYYLTIRIIVPVANLH